MRVLYLLLSASALLGQQAKWTPLFDGKSLHGWETRGKAAWTVEGGELVGRQGEGGAPGDLFTLERFTNFELEAAWRMKWPGNSGFWFKYQGPSTGCQADFLDEPAYPGVLSGSIYCMGLKFIAENRAPETVRKGEWNTLRVRVEGDRAQVWMNGKLVADGRANVFPGPGQLGVQVHAGKQFEGMEIRLRDVKVRRLP